MAPSISLGTQYALVVDAGSSGSRLQIYSWRDPSLERAEILAEVREARAAGLADGRAESSRWWWWDSIKGKAKTSAHEMEKRALRRLVRVGKGVLGEDWVKRVEPGISTMAPDDIPAYLSPLLSHALEHIPPSMHAKTPIYVLATAGMRLLSDERQLAILRATCDTLRRDYPFLVDDESGAGPCGDSVRIISGEEEGIWGWVAVNYLMDGFGHAPDKDHVDGQTEHDHLLPLPSVAHPAHGSRNDGLTPVDVHHHSPTFGFLDMGGASTQLAFSPTDEELAKSQFPRSDLASVSLRLLSGEIVQWPVFAASWLQFGTNKARERYVDAVVKQHSGSEHITDACLPIGLRIPTLDKSKHPDFIGGGNFSECLTSLKPLLKQDAPCPAQHCLFGGLATPHIDFHRQDQRGFIGVSEYWYTANQVLGLGGVWDWAEWERSMNDFCSQDWKHIEEKLKSGERGSDVELSRLQMQCFKGAWISNVLHEGIGIPRLVDAGGNDTLTGGELGDTNAEAERRAREKGLIGKKSHFQSMDEVDHTAISWTLGKVVIEASKAVAAAGPLPGHTWTIPYRVGDLTLAMWGYIFVGAAIITILINAVRRRRPLRRKHRRGNSGSKFLGLGHPCPGGPDDAYEYEEAGEGKRPKSKWAMWFRRVSQTVRRGNTISERRGQRHASLPLSSSGGWSSQPSSPRSVSGFSTQTHTPPSYPRSFSMADMSASASAAATPPLPPKGTARSNRPSPRPRQNSGNSPYLAPTTSGGWNDPPMTLLATTSPSLNTASLPGYDSSTDDERPRSVLTPSAGPGHEQALSRQSSRVNLSDMGLAQRSRNNTPHIG